MSHDTPPEAGQPPKTGRITGHWLLALVALVAICVSIVQLEHGRAGLDISEMRIGTTPATLYRKPGNTGEASSPLVVVAHGFAGSRQLMQAYSLTLAQSGYTVLAFDFEGHGRNPVPMSGDVTSIDGTTALLVAETRRVIAAGRTLPNVTGAVALLGHSMATDIIVRAAIAERAAGTPIAGIVAISMFSGAVTATEPDRLLMISGQWEGTLRSVALDNLRQLQPDAAEGESVSAGGIVRRAVVAPAVEHVGVLFSGTALREARAWLDDAFDRKSAGPIVRPGLWIVLLLGGIVALLHPLSRLLPRRPQPAIAIPARRFWMALLLPAFLVPLVGTAVYVPFMPVLVADYLMAHLAVYGGLQLMLIWRLTGRALSIPAILLLAIWGIAVFGFAMDRYAASFVPNAERLTIIAILCIGTIPFMVADSVLTGAGSGRWWQRIAARTALLLSLAGAALLDPERLMFLFIILPVLLLFLLMHGLMGRWIGQRSGPVSAGIGLGLCLAWSLGVTFPLFSAG
ncbi:MAG: alpha/beta hydrolase [Oceanibaculum nanhaiense]|uniref:alpha/beta fold hydrolase n=1 Tax=Oceanibaculum nanhaiense TaxID=1909734 RepID=UPI0025A3ADE7|nr:alpha/beta fold hydrolase [Oceanibaculum nanhaiense]MDM7947108.1 alpha/beta hydrolase [Oceanibaculum nanhaiense]